MKPIQPIKPGDVVIVSIAVRQCGVTGCCRPQRQDSPVCWYHRFLAGRRGQPLPASLGSLERRRQWEHETVQQLCGCVARAGWN